MLTTPLRREFLTLPADTPLPQIPYPGLRPFEESESDIFIGRMEQIVKLIDKLQQRRFLAVVGPSGCGKSSIVRAGLLPELGGLLFRDKRKWRAAVFRPGTRPLANMANALLKSRALTEQESTNDSLADETDNLYKSGFLYSQLRRSPLGLIRVLEEKPARPDTNLLLLVDQFEEIFRYENHSDEADAFIALLLETVKQATEKPKDVPIYVVITMRSDFIGDCNRYPGLPEVISNSQFLTPRMTRDERYAAIVGPACMNGGEVGDELVNRLLNDMGDDPDQLPILQHALMRMWLEASNRNGDDRSTNEETVRRSAELQVPSESGTGTEPAIITKLTVEDYERAGGWKHTLSNHCNEVFEELGSPRRQQIAEVLFRRLTNHQSDQRDVRCPTTFGEIASVAQLYTPEQKNELREVVERFSDPDCCFLTPRLGTNLTDDTVIDISHESLIRQWDKFHEWSRKESDAVKEYRRLSEDSQLYKGREHEWPELMRKLAIDWQTKNEPTAAWAERYGGDFDASIVFLEKCAKLASQKRRRRVAAFVIAPVLIAVFVLAVTANNLRVAADARYTAMAQAGVGEAIGNWYENNSETAVDNVRDASVAWSAIKDQDRKTEVGLSLSDRISEWAFDTTFGAPLNDDSRKQLKSIIERANEILSQLDRVEGTTLQRAKNSLLRALFDENKEMLLTAKRELQGFVNRDPKLVRWLVAAHFTNGTLLIDRKSQRNEYAEADRIYSKLKPADQELVPKRLFAKLQVNLAFVTDDKAESIRRKKSAAFVYLQLSDFEMAATVFYDIGLNEEREDDKSTAFAMAAFAWDLIDTTNFDEEEASRRAYTYLLIGDSYSFFRKAVEVVERMKSPRPSLVRDAYINLADFELRMVKRAIAKAQDQDACRHLKESGKALESGLALLKTIRDDNKTSNQHQSEAVKHINEIEQRVIELVEYARGNPLLTEFADDLKKSQDLNNE